MNTRSSSTLAIAVAAVLFAACSSTPSKPEGLDNVRSKLTRLQSDPQLASRAPVAIKEAEAAVLAAGAPRKDMQLSNHLVVLADRKVELAEAQAQTRWLEDQRKSLNEQQQTARLDARTREAEGARSDADTARADANQARSEAGDAQRDETAARAAANLSRADAENARIATDVARLDTAAAERRSEQMQRAARLQSDELQRQIAALNAKKTDRGLVVTLGDVLFSTGQSDLKGGAQNNLGKLADFLNKYPESRVTIEGHTDNVGNDDMNQGLSQRRADSVKSFLTSHGVDAARLSSIGKGEGTPVAGNDSTTGRQQNRRVEVIIANPPATAQAQ